LLIQISQLVINTENLAKIGIVDGAYNKADITCRSLLLGATGDTPTPKDGKGNYMRLFGLNDDRLHGMRGQTLADFGCGASFFCAEIAVLYQVDAMGVDLMSANEFAQYSRESTARYATSMYVLYGRKKIESKHGTEMKLIEKIIDHMDQIIETYGEGGWLQTGKDILIPTRFQKRGRSLYRVICWAISRERHKRRLSITFYPKRNRKPISLRLTRLNR
jgi:hypothetical protein